MGKLNFKCGTLLDRKDLGQLLRIIIVYDVTQQKSFEGLNKWLKEIGVFADKEVCKLLVGNKTDLGDRVISEEQGKKMAAEMKAPFLETSAKEDTNVREAFHKIAEDIKIKYIDSQG